MYYIRINLPDRYVNLLYRPTGEDPLGSTNEMLRRLAQKVGSDRGSLWYFDTDQECLRTLKVSLIEEVRVWRYDGEAPYEGLYADVQGAEVLDGRR